MDGIIGMIKLSLSVQSPNGWRLCNGESLEIASYPALYKLIGNEFGGENPKFMLPNIQSEESAYYHMKVEDDSSHTNFRGLVSQMVIWPGQLLPEGWLPCDGRLIVGSDFPLLHKMVALEYPNVSEVFNLPMAEFAHGLRYIICMVGDDPTADMRGTQKPKDDDDY